MTSITSWPGVPAGFAPRLERLLGLATVGASAPGEIFAAIDRARESDPESWVKEFFDLAARLEGEAEASISRGHRASAASDLRRATSYFRFAERGADPEAPFVARFASRRRAAFERFLDIDGIRWESIDSPPGFDARWFGAGVDTATRAPLILLAAFADVLEDVFTTPGAVALGRGRDVTIVTPLGDPEASIVTLEALRPGSSCPGSGRGSTTGVSEGHHPEGDLLRPVIVAFEDAASHALSLATRLPQAGSPAHPSSPSHTSDSTACWRGLVFDSPRLPVEAGAREAALAAAARLAVPTIVLAGEADSDRGMQDAKALFGALTGPRHLHFFETELGAGSPRQAGNPLHGANILLDWIDRLPA